MSAEMAAFMMDAEYRWFQDCDDAYMRERRSAVIPGASIVAERKTAADTLLASVTQAIEANQYNYAAIIADDLLVVLERISKIEKIAGWVR